MNIEKERKFLVNNDHHSVILAYSDHYREIIQMYIVDEEDHSLRIRIINNIKATICYKKYVSEDTKIEHEFTFPLEVANQLYYSQEYHSIIEKTRYYLDGWEIDCYKNHNNLMIAEYEFSENNPIPNPLPKWVQKDVTGVYEYTNPYLAKKM